MKFTKEDLDSKTDFMGNKMRSYTCTKCKTKIRSMVIGKTHRTCAECANKADGVINENE